MTADNEHLGHQSEQTLLRAGRTVRRPVRAWTPAVQALLRYLEAAGFDGTPRVLGIDEQGREVLSVIEGVSGDRRAPAAIHEDAALIETARFIRRLHEAAAGFVPPVDARWQFMAGAPRDGIVCHNDLGPVNTIYVDGLPRAVIDWEFAAPAPPEWAMACAAWRYVPLYPDADCVRLGIPVQPRGPRLRLFCDAYGLEQRDGFIDLIRRRQQSLYDTVRDGAATGDPSFGNVWETTHGKQWLRSIAYLDAERTDWERWLHG